LGNKRILTIKYFYSFFKKKMKTIILSYLQELFYR